jgi:hypothetical protein
MAAGNPQGKLPGREAGCVVAETDLELAVLAFEN